MVGRSRERCVVERMRGARRSAGKKASEGMRGAHLVRRMQLLRQTREVGGEQDVVVLLRVSNGGRSNVSSTLAIANPPPRPPSSTCVTVR